MSRQASNKNKADKAAKGAGGGGGTQQHVVTSHVTDFIPQRFTLANWASLSNEDEDISFISDVVSEIINKVTDACYQVHITKQVSSKNINVLRLLLNSYLFFLALLSINSIFETS